MQFVIDRIHSQLFPDGEYVEQSIVVVTADGKRVVKLKAVLSKSENLQFAFVEVPIEFLTWTCEALLILMKLFQKQALIWQRLVVKSRNRT
jgi:hypothetical protein